MGPIALYGLSADPPHQGHRAILNLLSQYFDQVWFWAVDNPLKDQQLTPLHHRQAMTALLVGADPKLVHRPEFTSPWTASSVALIRAQYSELQLWIALGSDALQQVAQWANLPLLQAEVTGFVELRRRGLSAGPSTVLGLPVRTLATRIPPYSSQEIRAQLQRGEYPAGLESEVYRYIVAQGLYPAFGNAPPD